MQSYKSHLSLLQATGSNPRLAQIKTPQLLLDFLVEQVETQTAILNGRPSKSDLQELLRRIMRKAKPCFSSVVVALFYLDRLWRQLHNPNTSSGPSSSSSASSKSQFGRSGLPEVIAAFILADKYLYDIALANCEWAKVSGTHTVAQVNSYEREFFGRLNYNIQFTEQEYLEFVSFLEVSLTIRHHRMQATADFPLTYADLCQVAEAEASSASSSSESLMDTSPSSSPNIDNSAKSSIAAANRRPTEATLISLRAMMICCVTYCAVMFTVTAAVQGIKASVELKRQQDQAASVTAAAAAAAAGYGNSNNKPARHGAISRSESWNGCSSSASAVPKPTGRKFSDAMMEDSNPWFLQATSGRIRS